MRKVPAGDAELLRSQHTLKAGTPALCWMQSTVRGGRSLVPTTTTKQNKNARSWYKETKSDFTANFKET